MKSAYLKGCIGLAVLLSVMFAVGCATTGPPLFGAKGENPGPMPEGSSYVEERRDSGSFGSGTYLLTYKSLGMQTWQGRKVYASDSPEGTLLLRSHQHEVGCVRKRDHAPCELGSSPGMRIIRSG